MESDPILTYAPRRHDGRLGLHQWPAGYPVAYDPEEVRSLGGDGGLPGHERRIPPVRTFPAVIERSPETGLFVGYVPGFPGAHSQGETLEELNENLKEVVQMLLEDGEPAISTEFIGIYTVQVA
jgi:predicted RNase H-like HicB family nuclease